MNRENELQVISFLKVMCMLLVVFGHACAVYTGSWCGFTPLTNAAVLGFINKWFSTFHVQAFTFASGYIFYYLRYEKGKYRNTKKDIIKRSKRLLLPYCVFALWAIVFDVIYGAISIKGVIKNYLFAVSPSQLWFLVMLFSVFLLFYFVGDYLEKIPGVISFALLLAIYYASGVIGKYLPLGFFQIGRTLEYMIFYYLGFIIRKYCDRISQWQRRGVIITEIGFVLPFLYLTTYKANILAPINTFVEPFISVVGVLFLYFISQMLCEKVRLETKIFNTLKDNSMGIYLIHQQIMYVGLSLFMRGGETPLITVIMSFVFSMVASTFFSIVIRKTKFGRSCLGE